MIRAFIALELPDETITEIISLRNDLFVQYSNLHWEKKDKLHITLKFLGDSEKNVLDSLAEDLQRLIEQQKNKFHLTFDKFGIFKRNNVPSILWIGAKDNNDLSGFAGAVDELCTAYSYPKEIRAFKTHITLLRIKQNINSELLVESAKQKFNEITTVAEKITLYKSQLLKSGSVYMPIKSFIIKN